MPYSLGDEKLEPPPIKPKSSLDPNEEEKLSGDMRELYDRLRPSKESEERRVKFVQKLERILNDQWPGNDIKVHVFGSSGNMLYTSDSDGQFVYKGWIVPISDSCLQWTFVLLHP